MERETSNLIDITTLNGSTIKVNVFNAEIPEDTIHQWDIRFVDLGEANEYNKECGKCRPCIILQSDYYNSLTDARIWVYPLSTSPMYNCYNDILYGIKLEGERVSIVGFDCIMTVSKSKVQRKICDAPIELRNKIITYIINRLTSNGRVEDSMMDNDIGESIKKEFEEDMMSSRFCPSLVRSKSIRWCKYFYDIFNEFGESYFENTFEFNQKTFKYTISELENRIKLEL